MISYTDSCDGITAKMLTGFFVGWPNPPSSEKHRELLTRSDEVVLAIDDKIPEVVGFITAITDEVLAAYIPHLEVKQTYQRQGIGSELLRRMLAKLEGFYMVDLICDPDVQPFYTKHEMRPWSGMIIRRHDRQSGRIPGG